MIDQHHDDPARLRDSIELFYFAYRAFTEQADRLLERHGLGRVHHRILYFVGSQPGMAVGELLATLRISKQALNAPLRQLLAMELVTMTVDDQDRRVRRLALTVGGRKLEAQLTGRQTAQLAAAFTTAGDAAAAGWRQVMAGIGGR